MGLQIRNCRKTKEGQQRLNRCKGLVGKQTGKRWVILELFVGISNRR
jgi:hypothetical protein